MKRKYRKADGSIDYEAIQNDVWRNETYTQDKAEIIAVRFEGEEPVLGWTEP